MLTPGEPETREQARRACGTAAQSALSMGVQKLWLCQRIAAMLYHVRCEPARYLRHRMRVRTRAKHAACCGMHVTGAVTAQRKGRLVAEWRRAHGKRQRPRDALPSGS